MDLQFCPLFEIEIGHYYRPLIDCSLEGTKKNLFLLFLFNYFTMKKFHKSAFDYFTEIFFFFLHKFDILIGFIKIDPYPSSLFSLLKNPILIQSFRRKFMLQRVNQAIVDNLYLGFLLIQSIKQITLQFDLKQNTELVEIKTLFLHPTCKPWFSFFIQPVNLVSLYSSNL